MVEVRKPGRPLQSCGHRLATCVCGRLTDSCYIGDSESLLRNLFLPASFLIDILVVTAPLRPRQLSASSTRQSKSKFRTWNQSLSRKRPRTKSQSSNASLPEDAQKSENITITKNGEQSEESGKLNNTIQQPDIFQEPGLYQTSDTVVSPTYSVAQLPPEDYAPTHFIRPMTALCTASETRSYPAKPDAGLPEKSQHPYFLGQGPTQIRASLTRIKDVSIISNTESSRQNGTMDQ
jgi:hypothetical protein